MNADALELFRLLRCAAQSHKEMELRYSETLTELTPEGPKLRFPNLQLNRRQYFSKNVFSILFLSFLKYLSIPPQRILEYGLITHAIRGIVTASDNILDKENKGAVFFASAEAAVLPNVGLMLLHQTALHEALCRLISDQHSRMDAYSRLFGNLFAVGMQEMGEESRIEKALAPEEIISSVHHFKGGKLLSLPFTLPLIVETEFREPLLALQSSMYHLGMSVQILDDITDLTRDVSDGRHNLLRSIIVHNGPDGAMSDVDLTHACRSGSCDPMRDFPKAINNAAALSMRSVNEGISALEAMGYPIHASSARLLLKFLFKTRNVWFLWNQLARSGVAAQG